ncbi:MAG: efflux RND transporter periplasmic adaptor subunit [Anaerolineae bacterium]|nr:efflux RND transporter periplasmic adaptor subunit [Anaerolineae bacterium]
MNVLKRLSGKKVLALGIMALLVAVSIITYSIWQVNAASASRSTSTAYQTDRVRKSDISLSSAGSGSLITETSVDLGFETGGVLAELNVQPGSQVKAGDVLAVLDDIDELKQAVTTKELALQEAQTELDDLLDSAQKNLAQALLDVSNAQATQVWSENHVVQKNTQRCTDSTTYTYLMQYIYDSSDYNAWNRHLTDGSGYGTSFIQENINKYNKKMYESYENWKYCEGYTDNEILASDANNQLAEANYQKAETVYENLKNNEGLDPKAIALAQAKVTNAQNELKSAKTDLEGATIVAPMDGTIISVDYKVGETIKDPSDGVTPIMTLADLKHPVLQVYIDQADMQNFQVNCKADVSFDALPNQTFSGIVTQVYPTVTSSSGSDTLEGIVQLDDITSTLKQELPLNLPAMVDVVCSEANNVLIVSVNSIYDIAGDHPYVYVLNSLGQPEKREVTIGLANDSFAEIKSGLSEGENVISESIKEN